MQAEITNLKTKSLFDNPYEVNGVKVVTAMLTNTRPDMLRKMGDELKAREADAAAVVAGVDGEKANPYRSQARMLLQRVHTQAR